MDAANRERQFSCLSFEDRHASLLRKMMGSIEWGPLIYEGKFERMLKTLSKITRVALRSACEKIFEHENLEAQASYYRDGFPHLRWKLVLALLGNSTALNSLLYKGDFPAKNISKSYFRIYADIFEHLMTEIPARDSFFLQLIFQGRIRYLEGLPIECRSDVYELARRHLAQCDVQFVEDDILRSFGATGGAIDFLSFSDVPSFLPDDLAYRCLQLAHAHMAPGGLAVIRGHVRQVRPDITGYIDVSHTYSELTAQESTGLWHFGSYRVA